jgi:hypothetical protein
MALLPVPPTRPAKAVIGTAVVNKKAPAKIVALTFVFIFSSFWDQFAQLISNGHANAEDNYNGLYL